MIKLTNVNLESKYLLAVSGGIDSMAMAHLFVNLEYKCAIAHCNFTLRGKDSDLDEELVCNFANKNNIPFYTIRFNTEDYANENGISTQIAARELRYKWFDEIRLANGFNKICLAHNADDNIETFFINLYRGAGLNGLTGMPDNTATLLRPIITSYRKDIEIYVQKNDVIYREDSSNSSTKYLRNKIRHLVLPVLDNIDSSFRNKATLSLNYLANANDFIKTETELFVKQNTSLKGEDLYIPIKKLTELHSREIRLFYLLEKYGFRGDAISNISKCIDNAVSGKQFYSNTHCLLIDREDLIISPIIKNSSVFEITENSDIASEYFSFHSEAVEIDSNFALAKKAHIGEFDISKLQFPLILRVWEPGDWFVPLGMQGKKKLSDFFIDIKLPITDKKRQMVLVSGENIIWVVGLRPDDRFKVTTDLKYIFKTTFLRLFG